MKHYFDDVLYDIANRSREDPDIEFGTISLRISFMSHHAVYKDTYLKYNYFRILHKRLYTNKKLYKMGIKNLIYVACAA